MSEFNEPSAIAGAAVLREAANLIRGLRVAPGQAAMAEGEEVTILIAPCWREDKTFALSFTCRARGLQKVDWSRLYLKVDAPPEENLRAERIELNPRGQGWLKGCKPIEYTLVATCLERFSVRAPAGPAKSGKLTPALAAGQTVTPTSPERLYKSPDDRVWVKINAREEHLEIVCTTGAAELDGAMIAIRRRIADAPDLQNLGELFLREAERGLWKGRWEGTNLSEEEELVLEVIPQPAPSGEQP